MTLAGRQIYGTDYLIAALYYTLIPVLAAIVGGLFTAYRQPSPLFVGAIQHFAAGVVFAAAAAEILPNLKHADALWPVVIGGGIGIAAMMALKHLGSRAEGKRGLVTLIAADLLIDGIVLGLAFQSGEKAGLLLTIALTIEVLFLGLSVAAELGQANLGRNAILGWTAALAFMLPIGVAGAAPIAFLPDAYVKGAFAFGLIALLYLVTEELLVEAHEVEDRPWTSALFFIGFLILLVLEDIF